METKHRKARFSAIALALSGVLVFLAFIAGGDKNPNTPALAAGETVSQAQSIPSLPYTINQPGSYYLTKNLTLTDRYANAIEVKADNVTIDLAGYSIIGPGADSGTNNGIYMNGQVNVEIRNGTVTEFGNNGIYEESADNGTGHKVIGVRITSNGAHGIMLEGAYHVIKDCIAVYNCLAINSGFGGISCGAASTITGNVASNNAIIGISTNSGCTISGNIVSGNTFGISPWYGCSVSDNTITYNTDFGIETPQPGSLIKNNIIRGSDTGILVSSPYNSIEGNLITNCTTGIDFADSQNVYADNRALYNTNNFDGDVPTGSGDGGGNISFGTLVMGDQLEAETGRSKTARSAAKRQ